MDPKNKGQRTECFHPLTSQSDVFENVTPLIQSALDGYNVCIFTYKQTGSGKTFTMEGTEGELGVIPRTIDLLFDSVKNYKRITREYEIRATFLEIYNEVLYDLLNPKATDLEIRMISASSKTDVYVSNITEKIVENGQQLRALMDAAKHNRATACTVGNERSSRSPHAITRLQLIGVHVGKQEKCVGTVNLVDLAGLEFPKTSTRMEETKKINRSLSELTNVIMWPPAAPKFYF
ncbi:protein claret segregational-like [Lutzomyia longipalpis]|uniref:protein claret segregational-like n=1 Tax=Lutzomyia longipalpis TaxID=7200 RepID=UPI00248404B9|nr:protein claret segregational-like [Lutzomyia longipalpis]